MDGLTAKVFRTYNASKTLQDQLDLLTKSKANVSEKVLAYNRANRQVALLCNHQRSVPKTFERSMETLKAKVGSRCASLAYCVAWMGSMLMLFSFRSMRRERKWTNRRTNWNERKQNPRTLEVKHLKSRRHPSTGVEICWIVDVRFWIGNWNRWRRSSSVRTKHWRNWKCKRSIEKRTKTSRLAHRNWTISIHVSV